MATKKELEDQLAATQAELQKMKSVMEHMNVKKPASQYKEKKVTKFNGDGDVIDWTREILDYVNTRFDTDAVKVDYIVDHLEGKAKKEIKYRLLGVTSNAEDVTEMLIDTFGDRDKAVRLQQTFYSRIQRADETTEDYAYALTDLIIKMTNVGVKLAYTTDQILKERFADGVADPSLGRELNRLNTESATLKFHELRKKALLWEDRDRTDYRRSAVKASSEQMAAPTVMQLLQNQQKQLEQMQKLIKTNTSGTTSEEKNSSHTQQTSQSTSSCKPVTVKKAKFICNYCKEPNHRVKDCILVQEKERKKRLQTVEHQEVSTEVDPTHPGNE